MTIGKNKIKFTEKFKRFVSDFTNDNKKYFWRLLKEST